MRHYPHLLNRNGHYYFRMAVPSSLRLSLDQRELFYSLKTKDYLEARTRSVALLQVAEDVFKQRNTPDLANYLKECLGGITFLQKPQQPVQDSLLSKTLPDPASKETVSSVYQSYLSECGGDREKTLNKRKSVLTLWLEIIGDGPITAITKDKARHFKNILMRLPANMKQRYGVTPIKEIDLDKIPADQRLSAKTINDKLIWMSAFTNWAIKNGYYETANPFKGLALKQTEIVKDRRLPFSQKQLEKIFSTPIYTGKKSSKQDDSTESGNTIVKDAFYWVPLIALYSGARLQEICQLYVTDIKQVGAIWVFDFNEDGKDKRLKTSSSNRKTPTLLVLLDESLEAFEIHEAMRADILTALSAPGSKARNERCALAISKFKSIGKKRWERYA